MINAIAAISTVAPYYCNVVNKIDAFYIASLCTKSTTHAEFRIHFYHTVITFFHINHSNASQQMTSTSAVIDRMIAFAECLPIVAWLAQHKACQLLPPRGSTELPRCALMRSTTAALVYLPCSKRFMHSECALRSMLCLVAAILRHILAWLQTDA